VVKNALWRKALIVAGFEKASAQKWNSSDYFLHNVWTLFLQWKRYCSKARVDATI